MNIKSFINIRKAITAAVLFTDLAVYAQPKNLTVKIYGPRSLDVTVLDARFDDVIVDGAVRTADYTGNTDWETLPTSVSGFGGVQMLVIGGSGNGTPWRFVTQAQADALVQFVREGGILISAFNGVWVGNTYTKEINEYIGEKLMPGTNINPVAASPSWPVGANPPNVNYHVPAYHNGTWPLGLYTNSSSYVVSGTIATTYQNVPPASAVYGGTAKPTGSCSSFHVLEFLAPSYPGSVTALNNNVKGFAYLSGEPGGGTLGLTTIPSGGYGSNNDADNNKNLAGLIYDFLYNPAGMVTRRSWSGTSGNPSSNVNTACPPTTFTTECAAGGIAPKIQ